MVSQVLKNSQKWNFVKLNNALYCGHNFIFVHMHTVHVLLLLVLINFKLAIGRVQFVSHEMVLWLRMEQWSVLHF
jgi:hypothetical protein